MNAESIAPLLTLVILFLFAGINWRYTGTLRGHFKGIAEVAPHARQWVLAAEQLANSGQLAR